MSTKPTVHYVMSYPYWWTT